MSKPNIPFDLVILDLDGTILDLYHAHGISVRVQAAIAAVQAAGIPVTIGTGRTLDYIRQNLAHLPLTYPMVTMQGAVIGDPVTGKILAETAIPLIPTRQIAQWIDASAYVTAFYFNDREGHTRVYQNRLHSNPANQDFYDHVFGAPRSLAPSFVDLLMPPDVQPLLKFIIDNDLTDQPNLAPELQRLFGTTLNITRTHPRLVEGTAVGVDKGQGVLRLCQLLGIDPQRVLVIGDNDNDIPMLAAVGFGVAMGNATSGVKAIAQWLAPSISEDGAAVALEKLILQQLISASC